MSNMPHLLKEIKSIVDLQINIKVFYIDHIDAKNRILCKSSAPLGNKIFCLDCSMFQLFTVASPRCNVNPS